jgi:integrase
MQLQPKPAGARRQAGTGCLYVRADRAGRDTWYGKVWVGERQVKRRLGRCREPGTTIGLTRRQAERALRELTAELQAAPPPVERLSFATAAERYIRHVEVVRRRRETTVRDYRSVVRRHLVPFFAGKGIEGIEPDLIEAYMATKRRDDLAPKTIANHLTLLHGIFAHALRKGWARANPVAAVDRPAQGGADPDIRFLDREELEALLRACPEDPLGEMERTLYLAAATAGLRQGELVALRWRDVDWTAGVVRVRRSYTRGRFTLPKSRRSTRAVPMADRLAGELERHYQRAAFRGDGDLVFAHPNTGGPYDASRLRKRFKAAVARAGLREVRFHDLRHTFGTLMAAAGAPLRAIQEWMGHRDYKTTSIYADYAPDPTGGARYAARAFGEDVYRRGATPQDSLRIPEDVRGRDYVGSR